MMFQWLTSIAVFDVKKQMQLVFLGNSVTLLPADDKVTLRNNDVVVMTSCICWFQGLNLHVKNFDVGFSLKMQQTC